MLLYGFYIVRHICAVHYMMRCMFAGFLMHLCLLFDWLAGTMEVRLAEGGSKTSKHYSKPNESRRLSACRAAVWCNRDLYWLQKRMLVHTCSLSFVKVKRRDKKITVENSTKKSKQEALPWSSRSSSGLRMSVLFTRCEKANTSSCRDGHRNGGRSSAAMLRRSRARVNEL